ncbi:MAG: M28 family peptidase, partial [Armatimonadetes bacterium]|nr:M28 family peptidase [Armatimonadota bacterium]
FRPWRSLALLLLALTCVAAVAPEAEELVLKSETNYEAAASAVSYEELGATIRKLASLGSRVTGYPGCEQAAQFVEKRFRELGLDDVTVETFPVLVPVSMPDEKGRVSSLTVRDGRDFEILPMWPNLLRTTQTPPDGITGRLVYAGPGNLRAFNGTDVTDSIVLLDFNCGSEWFNAPLLGARACLFIEPQETIRGEAEQKFLSLPVDIPRFLVRRADADYLLSLLKSKEDVMVTVKSKVRWKRVQGKNIYGTIRGTDPRLSRHTVVVQSYYDSVSVTPDVAPGAESACSLATMFQMIKAFKDQPPKRTVLFLATSGHFESLAGTKWFIRNRVRGARIEKYVRRCFQTADKARRDIEDAAERVWEEEKTGPSKVKKTHDEIVEERYRALGRIYKALKSGVKRVRYLKKVIAKGRRVDPNRGKVKEKQLSPGELKERARLLDEFEQAVPDMQKSLQNAIAVVQQARREGRHASTEQREASLEKVKAALQEATDALDFSHKGISLWFSIDLSSHRPTFGIFYKAYFYNYSESIQWKFSDIGKKAREYGDLIAAALSVNRADRLVDGINAIQGKNWQTYMAGKLALSSEVATIAGIPGVGFATINDSRPMVDTPLDTPDQVDLDNLYEQNKFLACLLLDLVNITEPKKIYDLQLEDNFVEVKGRLVRFDPTVSTFPDEPIPGAMAVARTGTKSAMGVRCEPVDMANQEGRIHILGLPNVRARGGVVPVEGYLLDPADGHIAMAPDRGVNGAEAYPIELSLDQDIKPVTVVMFRCKPMVVFDMVDQRFFELLREISVLDSATDARPYQYGYCLPLPPQQFVSAYEPVALVFAPSGTKVKVLMGASVLGLRFILVNPTARQPEGEGFLIDAHPSMYATPFRVAMDMWRVDDVRTKRLKNHGIENVRVDKAHKRARDELLAAIQALEHREYDQFMTAARAAWSFESRAYPDVRRTGSDVVRGVIFYLALLLPFAFFMERLLVAAPDVKWQIIWFFIIFTLVFVVLWMVHPAFSITFTPIIILLAFIILALTVLVIYIIVQKFEEQMKEIKYEQTGVRTADVGRLSASGAAFRLGISNMRRRKLRSILTSVTLILLTFTVLSTTSVVETVRPNRILLPKVAPYNGIMIRDKTWAPIGEPTTRIMRNEFGASYPVAPRAWYFSARVGEQSFVTVSRADMSYAATAMVGLTPEEAEVTRPQRYLLPGGRWFRPDDSLVCIIPEAMAEKLSIDREDVGHVYVEVFGTNLKVIGIVDSNRFKKVVDLDGEQITPVDYLLMQEQQAQQQQQAARGGRMSEEELREYIHLAPDQVLIVPYRYVIDAGGTLRCVAIQIPEAREVKEHLDDLMQRIELNIYAGLDGRTYLVSAVSTTQLGGTKELVIPLLIAAAIVLNTMLGSVYERVREIYIYSSLGLAPTHIAFLFVAEAMVYAVVGAVAGYLFGQMMSKLLVTLHAMEGLNLNYSSVSTVWSTLVIMITVLLSVIYPARKAS